MPLSSLSPLCFSTPFFSLLFLSPPLPLIHFLFLLILIVLYVLFFFHISSPSSSIPASSFFLSSFLLFFLLFSFPLLPPPILTRSKGWSGLCHCTTTISMGSWQTRWVLVRPFRPLPSSPTSWRRKGTMDRFSSSFLSRESRTKLKYAIDCISEPPLNSSCSL